MTIDEYRTALQKLDEAQFKRFKEDWDVEQSKSRDACVQDFAENEALRASGILRLYLQQFSVEGRSVTAHHEAAHAVVKYRMAGFADDEVSIVPDLESGGLGHAVDAFSKTENPSHMEAKIVSVYAGGHAQQRLDPSWGMAGCDDDEAKASAWLRLFGWESREQELRSKSYELVERHWREIEAVAKQLLDHQTLDDTEVETIADIVGGADPDEAAVTWEDLAQYRALRYGRGEGRSR